LKQVNFCTSHFIKMVHWNMKIISKFNYMEYKANFKRSQTTPDISVNIKEFY